MSTIQGAIAGVILATLLALVLILCVQHRQIMKDQSHYEELLKDKAVLQMANENWQIVANDQNKKLAQLVELQKATTAAAAKAVAEAQKYAQRSTKLAKKIAAYKATPDDCMGATDIKNFYLRNRK
jgi:hypothetical protein